MSWNFLKYADTAMPGKKERQCIKLMMIREKKSPKNIMSKIEKKRVFSQAWLVGRPWLLHDPDKNVMKCTLCSKYQNELQVSENLRGQGAFGKEGSTNLKKSAVVEHEESVFYTI